MSKHTPGPWFVGNDPCVIESDHADNDIGFIAMTLPDPDLGWDLNPERAANARLIAAAPELLEALLDCITDDESLALSCEDRRAIGYARRRILAINEVARAAIAKATGVTT